MFGLLIASLFVSALADNWAVLVAGSNGFWNYRHQSDIFHSYRILTSNGFDPNKIIVMAYDDIAQSSSNPFPGHVYNKPDGPDVYIGSDKIDYRGDDVNVDKFYAVLTGNSSAAGGKVLNSTENDNVFIFFDDHGGPGIICFPTGEDCYADELNDVLKKMHDDHKFKNLLFYVEACYSGSMFLNILSADLGIYVVTAANEDESSWAYYCDDDRYKTCLSNEFSQMWMVDTEGHDIKTETLSEQHDNVKANTKQSHVSEYGDLNMKTMKVAQFQSGNNTVSSSRSAQSTYAKAVRQEDAYLHYLELLAKENKFGDAAVTFNQELVKKEQFKAQAKKLARFFGIRYPSAFNSVETLSRDQMKVYRHALQTYQKRFGKLNEHNRWSHSVILYNAVSKGRLTADNFANFEKLLKKL